MQSESWFLIGVIGLASVAWFFLMRPFHRKIKMLMIPVIPVIIGICYWAFGSWPLWHQNEAKKRSLVTFAQRFKSVDDLIEQLKLKVTANPREAKGWYLLGRLYFGQEKWQPAKAAFAKALQLQPQAEIFQVNYVLAAFEANHQHFDAPLRQLISAILKKNPDQPDALVLAGKEAYLRQANKEAIQYWQRLLALLPPQSKEATVLKEAIFKASQDKK